MSTITFKNKIDILALPEVDVIVNKYKGNITNVTFDSREVLPNSIFFALKRKNTDGHNFVVDALNKGASVAVVEKVLPQLINISDKTVIRVSSPLKYMTNLAKEYRKKIKADIIGITGTIGKTTTKYLIANLLSKRFSTLVAPESYNNLLGLSFSLLNYNNEEKVILELGVNHPAEMDELVEIAKPNIAIITYITPVHLEGMKSIFTIFEEKQKIVKYAKKVLVNADSFLLNRVTHPLLVKIGTRQNLDYSGFLVKKNLYKTQFTINNQLFEIPTCFDMIIYPAMFSYALGKEYGLNYEEVYDAFKEFSLPKLRFQIIEKNDRVLVVDCYNANPYSMEKAIEQFQEVTPPTRAFIFGDMSELGDKSAFYHKKVTNIIKQFDGLKILVGENFKNGSDFLSKYNIDHYYFSKVEELINSLPVILTSKCKFIFLKASRKLQIEKLIEYF